MSTINPSDLAMSQEIRGIKEGERKEKMHSIANPRVDQHER